MRESPVEYPLYCGQQEENRSSSESLVSDRAKLRTLLVAVLLMVFDGLGDVVQEMRGGRMGGPTGIYDEYQQQIAERSHREERRLK